MELQSQQTTTTQQQSDEQASPNRQYKDTLFKYIFGREENKKWLLSLYNALAGTNHTDENEIEINTIENIIYITMKNDVSFLIGSEMYLLEHQSTFNPNLPLRGLLYFASLYSKYIIGKGNKRIAADGTEYIQDIYSSTIFKIPSPRFYVLYNGETKKADKTFLKLSDAFETPSEGFEWTATMLNVNWGHNKELLDACKSLQDFAKYVKIVQDNQRIHKMETEAAIDAALDEAIRLNLLEGFFKSHKAEVKMVCLTEFNKEQYDINRFMEGYDKGKDDGIHDTRIETARNAFKMGLSLEQISQLTSLPLAEVTTLQAEIATTA